MTTTTETFSSRASAFGAILDRVAGQWDATTPCDGWSVRDVVGHVIETERDFLAQRDLAAGDSPDLTDPAAAWRRHSGHVVDVLAHDGVADRMYEGYFGPTTVGATMADFYGWDLVVHGSDVARATGQPWQVSDDEAEQLHATADGWGPALYADGICEPAVPVPDDASATERLLARLGRDPRWRPAA